MKTKTLWDQSSPEVKAAITTKITRVVELVAEARSVSPLLIMSNRRECESIASARSMAMALCVEIGIEPCHIARAFRRCWETSYHALKVSETRYRNSAAFRAQWDRIKADEAFKA